MRIYLAGKIKADCWRHTIVNGLRAAITTADLPKHDSAFSPGWWPVLEKSISGKHDYVGPFFISCDHQCYHGDGTHGSGEFFGEHGGCSFGPTPAPDQTTVQLCLEAIDQADLVYCWIEDFDCFGTITEIGYALGRGVPVCIATPASFVEPDMWFPLSAADLRTTAPTAAQGLILAIRWIEKISEQSVNDFINGKKLSLHISKTDRLFRLAADMQDHFCNSREDALYRLQSSVSKIISDSEGISSGNASWRSLIDFAIVRPLKNALMTTQANKGAK